MPIFSQQALTTAAELGRDGALVANIDGFQPRQAQQDMAAAVTDAVLNGGQLLAEAGTGTGKTWAYLLPALLHSDRVIVSTGTKQLQDQLFLRDIPKLVAALNLDVSVALLKGRANYLCLHRIETAADGHDITPADHSYIQQLRTWARRTDDGDIAAAPQAPASKGMNHWIHWGRVTSSNDNCLGQQCDKYDSCFVAKARQRANEANVVVVNHYLLLADFALKDQGFGELLPDADTVIVDEAHQLPEIAGKFFGVSTSARQIRLMVDDARREQSELAEQDPLLMRHLTALEKATADFRLALGEEDLRGVWVQPPESIIEARDDLITALGRINAYLKEIKDRSPGMANAYERAADLLRSLNRLRANEAATAQADTEADTDDVHWFETRGRGFALHSTPLDVSKPLAEKVFSLPAAWILCSATLSVAGDFHHIKQQLGLPNASTLSLESPFDFANNSLLLMPPNMPEMPGVAATDALMTAILPVLKSTSGGAFLLFTSYRALHAAARFLKAEYADRVLVQGEQAPRQLIDDFVRRGNAWLLATQTFWEGVDVQGQALSVVVIDRLPFASPGDPVTAARIAAMNQSGNAFMDWQLPQAVINLKQGAGRLIRDVDDYGVLVLGDPRLRSKRYGQQFIDSLPPMPQTSDIEEASLFLKQRDLAKPAANDKTAKAARV